MSLHPSLPPLYWMGGSPCSGKSSIAQILTARFGLRYYPCDEAFYRHVRQITPEAQPTFHRVMHYSSEDLWMRPVVDLTSDELAVYHEEFPLILDDLQALPDQTPVLLEGAALLPELVDPLLEIKQRGIWIIPSSAFQKEHYARREWAKEIVKDCSDPKQAFQNWMERDILFALQVQQQARQRGLRVLVVDGSQSIEENAGLVEEYLGLQDIRPA